MSNNQAKHDEKSIQKGLKQYITGYALSIILTALSYFAATAMNAGKLTILIMLSVFACAQLLVQLIFFMHVTEEAKPRYVLINLIFFFVVVAIIALGTIYIMYKIQYTH